MTNFDLFSKTIVITFGFFVGLAFTAFIFGLCAAIVKPVISKPKYKTEKPNKDCKDCKDCKDDSND